MAKKKKTPTFAQTLLKNRFAMKTAEKTGYMLYGASRPWLSKQFNKLPFVKRFAGFEILDELSFIGMAYAGNKLGGRKIPVVRSFLKGADAIEWGRLGDFGRVQIGNAINNNGRNATNSSQSFSFGDK